MGVVERVDTGESFTLPARAVVGRGSDCAVRIVDPRVSGEHAAIGWRDGRWEIRDLASRNGTFMDGRQLEPGERVVLPLDGTFSLAPGGVVVRLVDATGPGSAAVGSDGTRLEADGGVLLLPDAEVAEVAVYGDGDGAWWLETQDGETRPAIDGEVVAAGGIGWTLALPRELPPTLVARPQDLSVDFKVSMDEEHAEMTVNVGGARHPLPARSFTYMLLTLARRRLDDCSGGVPEGERGWMYQEELAEALRLDPVTVGVYVHRARRQVGRIGDGVARSVVERRRGTRQLRLGLRVAGVERG